MDRHEIWTELSDEEKAEVSNLDLVRLGLPPRGALLPKYTFARPEPRQQPQRPQEFKSIRCAHCKGHHQTIAQVRLCAERQRRSQEG